MSLSFDGVNDQVNHGNIAGMNGASAYTLMCWVFPNALGALNGFVAKSVTAGTRTFTFSVGNTATDRILSGLTDGNFGETAAGTLVASVWAHWATVYDGSGIGNSGRLKAYKDGTDQALTFTGTIPATAGDSAGEPVRTGVSNKDASFLNGRIAHVKLWTAALTAAEVAQEVNSFRPVRTTNLALWSPYDDGTDARDYSGRGNHGTVTAATQAAPPPVGRGHIIIRY